MLIAIGVYIGRAVLGGGAPPAPCFATTAWNLSSTAWNSVATPWNSC